MEARPSLPWTPVLVGLVLRCQWHRMLAVHARKDLHQDSTLPASLSVNAGMLDRLTPS